MKLIIYLPVLVLLLGATIWFYAAHRNKPDFRIAGIALFVIGALVSTYAFATSLLHL